MIDWSIEAVAFSTCNCDYNCPCQFEMRPTHGDCRGFEAAEIERGHFGSVRLDGLRYAVTWAWPGPIFEGNGEMQVIVDERATPEQRQALETVLHGGETEEAKTHWWVFRAMSSTVHESLMRPIDLHVDIERRVARVAIPDVLEAEGRPIISPATGEEHRVRIDIPHGIEFELAEVGSATTHTQGVIRLELENTFGQFNRVHHTGQGVVRTRLAIDEMFERARADRRGLDAASAG